MAIQEQKSKVTSKGQITLPISWRENVGYNFDMVKFEQQGENLVIKPILTIEPDEYEKALIKAFEAGKVETISGKEFTALLKESIKNHGKEISKKNR